MTIRIEIGKLKILKFEDVIRKLFEDYYSVSYKQKLTAEMFMDIELCPSEIDGCTKDDTIYPNEPIRDGPTIDLYEWIHTVFDSELVECLYPNKTNDTQYTLIKPLIERINLVTYDGPTLMHKIRLKWFKFWCNKAVELYGDDAVIQWS